MEKERRPEQDGEILCEGKARKLCSSLLDMLRLFEKVQRKFHPLMIRKHGEALARKAAGLQSAMDEFSLKDPELIQRSDRKPVFQAIHTCSILLRSAALGMEAVSRFNASFDDFQAGILNAMQAGRKICRIRELLFELRHEVREIDDFFKGSPLECRQWKHETQEDTGRGERLIHMTEGQDPFARGIPSFFLPEMPGRKKRLPVIVALHGGFGHGRDFVWTWIREARCRDFILLAPTSAGMTWSLENPEIDLLPLIDLLKRLAGEYPLDLQKILLTGFSDGATFALGCSLLPETPFHAFSPVSGVLPPGELALARSRRIYWVHGVHDWMFPAARARSGCEILEKAEADITLKIIDDLAHAYPSEENAAILTWFDPVLFPGGRDSRYRRTRYDHGFGYGRS